MNVVVRKVFPGDANVMVPLEADLSVFVGTETVIFSAADFQRYGFGYRRLFDGVIAEGDGQPVGHAFYRDMYYMDLVSPGLHIMNLFVSETMCRQGVGPALLQGLAAACAAIDGTWMTLMPTASPSCHCLLSRYCRSPLCLCRF